MSPHPLNNLSVPRIQKPLPFLLRQFGHAHPSFNFLPPHLLRSLAGGSLLLPPSVGIRLRHPPARMLHPSLARGPPIRWLRFDLHILSVTSPASCEQPQEITRRQPQNNHWKMHC